MLAGLRVYGVGRSPGPKTGRERISQRCFDTPRSFAQPLEVSLGFGVALQDQQ